MRKAMDISKKIEKFKNELEITSSNRH